MNRRGRIFLVEDDDFQRRFLLESLRDDYEVAEASSGEECLERISDFAPDIVLLDVVLDGTDGLEVCRRIREGDPRLRHTKVVLISTRGDLQDRLRGYEAGADDYFAKPFDLNEILAKLHVLMRLRSEEEINDLKSQFLNLMSHETRTPLTSILGPANVLACDGIKDDDRKMFANMILESAHRLEDLVEKAMQLCSIRAGQAEMDPETLDLVVLTNSVVDELESFSTLKEVQVDVTGPASLTITADILFMNLMLRTLLERAIRVSPEDGRVRVTLEVNDEAITVAVEDEGEAIDASSIPTLFDDFCVPSVEFHTGSLGLDLALCGAIVTLLGGMIDVTAEGERGNHLRCRLPATLGERVSGAVTPVPAADQTVGAVG